MKPNRILSTLIALSAVVALPLTARTATLQAKVTEVKSGDTLIVSNINRQLRIKLKAIAPPETGQPFSDVAREHLKELVLDRPVTVDYTHFAEGVLLAKIIREGLDVGAQMIRDGVAWYDRDSSYELSQSDRELYAQCEQAARTEHRGLWRDPAPVSPWDYHKAQLEAKFIASSAAIATSSKARARKEKPAGLASEDLMGAMVGPGSLAGNPSFHQISPKSRPDEWIRFQSPDQRFSILVPGNSYEYEVPVLDSQQKIANFHYVAGADESAMYMMMWSKGPNDYPTDDAAAADVIKGLIAGINRGLERSGQSLRATATPIRDIKLADFTGKQYSFKLGFLSATVRVLSKQTGDKREVVLVGAFTAPGREPSREFMTSFKINPASVQ